jgi:hypothetical protein
LKKKLVKFTTKALLFLAEKSMLVLPIFFGLIYLKPKYILEYRSTLSKLRVHHKALAQGPVQRYLEKVWSIRGDSTESISGSCTQCGNCCLNKQCAFLEATNDGRYLCGVYNSPFRKLSNCGSFPISKEDIDRYECPGYFASQRLTIPIGIFKYEPPLKTPENSFSKESRFHFWK